MLECVLKVESASSIVDIILPFASHAKYGLDVLQTGVFPALLALIGQRQTPVKVPHQPHPSCVVRWNVVVLA